MKKVKKQNKFILFALAICLTLGAVLVPNMIAGKPVAVNAESGNTYTIRLSSIGFVCTDSGSYTRFDRYDVSIRQAGGAESAAVKMFYGSEASMVGGSTRYYFAAGLIKPEYGMYPEYIPNESIYVDFRISSYAASEETWYVYCRGVQYICGFDFEVFAPNEDIPDPITDERIPVVDGEGNYVFVNGVGQLGSGKNAASVLPVIDHEARPAFRNSMGQYLTFRGESMSINNVGALSSSKSGRTVAVRPTSSKDNEYAIKMDNGVIIPATRQKRAISFWEKLTHGLFSIIYDYYDLDTKMIPVSDYTNSGYFEIFRLPKESSTKWEQCYMDNPALTADSEYMYDDCDSPIGLRGNQLVNPAGHPVLASDAWPCYLIGGKYVTFGGEELTVNANYKLADKTGKVVHSVRYEEDIVFLDLKNGKGLLPARINSNVNIYKFYDLNGKEIPTSLAYYPDNYVTQDGYVRDETGQHLIEDDEDFEKADITIAVIGEAIGDFFGVIFDFIGTFFSGLLSNPTMAIIVIVIVALLVIWLIGKIRKMLNGK